MTIANWPGVLLAASICSFVFGTMPYLAFQKHPPNKIRRRLLTILSIQILPLLAAEFVFHAEEQEFMAKVERGEVEMGFWMMD